MRQKMIDGLMAVEVPARGVGQKSLYGKAWEISTSMGYELVSYSTKVARLEVGQGGTKLVRLWDGYSRTTMIHINAWLNEHGYRGGMTKKDWEKTEVGE